jgi:hypothetical protein
LSARQRSIVEPASSCRRTVQTGSGFFCFGSGSFCFGSGAGCSAGAMNDLKMVGTLFHTKPLSIPYAPPVSAGEALGAAATGATSVESLSISFVFSVDAATSTCASTSAASSASAPAASAAGSIAIGGAAAGLVGGSGADALRAERVGRFVA